MSRRPVYICMPWWRVCKHPSIASKKADMEFVWMHWEPEKDVVFCIPQCSDLLTTPTEFRNSAVSLCLVSRLLLSICQTKWQTRPHRSRKNNSAVTTWHDTAVSFFLSQELWSEQFPDRGHPPGLKPKIVCLMKGITIKGRALMKDKITWQRCWKHIGLSEHKAVEWMFLESGSDCPWDSLYSCKFAGSWPNIGLALRSWWWLRWNGGTSQGPEQQTEE